MPGRPDPFLLAVESSSLTFSTAVSEGDRVLAFLQSEGKTFPSTLLTDLIQQALGQPRWNLSDLEAIALSIGPGSFTGLRVGVMTVKTLAWSLKKPVLPVSSLEVIAQNLHDRKGEILLFVDARKGNVYCARFLCDGRFPARRLTPDELLRPEEALAQAAEGALVVGDGIRRYEELIRARGAGKFRLAPPESWVPRADWVCRLAAAAWPSGRMDDPHRLVPQYLYSQEGDVTGR